MFNKLLVSIKSGFERIVRNGKIDTKPAVSKKPIKTIMNKSKKDFFFSGKVNKLKTL